MVADEDNIDYQDLLGLTTAVITLQLVIVDYGRSVFTQYWTSLKNCCRINPLDPK